jgi:predicted transcriptional regulator
LEEKMSIKNLIQRRVVTIEPNDTVMLAAQRMHDKMVGSLVIIDGDKPLGIITDRDIALRVVGTGKSPMTKVKDVMTKKPITIREDTHFLDLTRAFRESKVRRLLVVDREGRLVGLISMDDVLETIATEFANLVTAINEQNN